MEKIAAVVWTVIRLLMLFIIVLILVVLQWLVQPVVRWTFGKESDIYKRYVNFLNIEE